MPLYLLFLIARHHARFAGFEDCKNSTLVSSRTIETVSTDDQASKYYLPHLSKLLSQSYDLSEG